MKVLPKYPSRARFGKEGEILAEFFAPLKKSNKVLILCSGMPANPGAATGALRTFAEKGYWVFLPRYAGSWESDGVFLEHSPHEDILAVIDGVQKRFTDVRGGVYSIQNPKVSVIGASFGGAAALLSSTDPRIVKVIALSPVVDWTQQGGTKEPLNDASENEIHAAWGNGYREAPGAYKKLATGSFYNPIREKAKMNGKKMLIIHSKEDMMVPFAPAQALAKELGATFVALKKNHHYGVSSSVKAPLKKHVEAFLKKK